MTNNQILRNEAARLDPATLHAIATAHHTPDEIAAIAAACKTTDENGNEQPATVGPDLIYNSKRWLPQEKCYIFPEILFGSVKDAASDSS